MGKVVSRSETVVMRGIFTGKIIKPAKKKGSFVGDWSKLDPRKAVFGFVLFVVGLGFLASGKLDSELIGLGMFLAGLGLMWFSVKDIWAR